MKKACSLGEVAAALVVAAITLLCALRASPSPEPAAPAAQTTAPAPTEAPASVNTSEPPAEESWETPADVARKEASFLEGAHNLSPRGSVRETFFTTQGVTDTVENVRIKNVTGTRKPDFASLLASPLTFSVPPNGAPTVLIFHTHTSEAYLPAFTGSFYSKEATRSSDPDENVVRVGRRLARTLERRGIGVLHDETVYDEVYTGAYAKSREKVLEYLKAYPSLQVVLDVHRDAVYETETLALKPTAEIEGRKTAQIMIITGAPEEGEEGYETWEQNLSFALHLQHKAETLSPGLMRPVFFCPRRYNMDVTPAALLLEVGSDVNTLAEADFAAYLIGEALGDVLLEARTGE